MNTFIRMLSFYAEHHHKTITKITHFIGVPIIIIGLQIFLNLFSLYHVSLAWVFLVVLFMYYLFLDVGLAFLTGLFLFLITLISLSITAHPLMLALLLFVLGWIIQFMGHVYEKKPPAFFQNIFQMLMAPIFLTAELCFLFGFRQDLKNEISHCRVD
jgi:uncharacterized membrane protein YGL010W